MKESTNSATFGSYPQLQLWVVGLLVKPPPLSFWVALSALCWGRGEKRKEHVDLPYSIPKQDSVAKISMDGPTLTCGIIGAKFPNSPQNKTMPLRE